MDAHLSACACAGGCASVPARISCSALPDVLALFSSRHPDVDVALTVALSETLYDQFEAGGLDIMFVKKRPGERRGVTAWRETVGWVAAPDFRHEDGDAVPLLLYPPPSVTRAGARHARSRQGAVARGLYQRLAERADGGGTRRAGRDAPLAAPGAARAGPAAPARRAARTAAIEFAVIGPGGHNLAAEALTAAILHWAAALGQDQGAREVPRQKVDQDAHPRRTLAAGRRDQM
jgi:hypothetical protein